MDIPAEEAEKLRLKIKSSEWEKVIRSLTQEEKRKVEQSISDYFQLYESICVLEKWEKDKKNYNLSDIQKLKLPVNADSYLIFYNFFTKIEIQNQNKLLASIITREMPFTPKTTTSSTSRARMTPTRTCEMP